MEQQLAAPGQEQTDADQAPGVQRYNDEFMMYVFKVETCKRVDKHDREKCPYAHPGEVARRRHPSLYQALPCPEARANKICPRLEKCNCSHSTFEFWLHPDRYKTFLCEHGASCNRPVCFFAHSEEELRDLPQGLQRTRPAHKPASSVGHSAQGGAGSSRQAAAVRSAGPASGPGNLVFVQAPGSAPQYVAQPVYAQQPQLQQQAGGAQGQAIIGNTPVMQHPQQLAVQQQGIQYVAMPVQQLRTSETELGSGADQPTAQVQPSQVFYAAPPPGAAAQQPSQQMPAAGQQQGAVYCTYQQAGPGHTIQPAPPAMAPYGGSVMYAGPQVLIGYQPVPVANAPAYAGQQSVVVRRPAPQRGSTVAVIPAGPSAWAGFVSAESGEAPSLEALCASMGQLSIPAIEHPQPPELLLLQYQHPGQILAQQQQQFPGQPMPTVLSGAPVLQQQQQAGMPGQQVVYAGAPGVQQVLSASLAQQDLQQQLLPGQQVVVRMPSAGGGASLQPSQPGWGGVGTMHP